MPTYEYRCESCSHQVEVFARMSDPPPVACEECGASELVKVLFPAAIHYKGSGFYATDYAGKGKDPAASGSTESAAPAKTADAPSASPAPAKTSSE
jgi:putative FmdB family regulatory protein